MAAQLRMGVYVMCMCMSVCLSSSGSSSGLYWPGADSLHQAAKASFGRCLTARRMYASIGRASAGVGWRQPAFASPSASLFPGILVWPGTQRTLVAPCASARAWNSIKTSWEESEGFPRRHEAAAILSRQITIYKSELRGIRRPVWRPRSAPVASALNTSAGPRRPQPRSTGSPS